MSLLITKINDASTSISYQYLDSEHVFGLLVSATYSFSIQDVQFEDGVDGLLNGVDALKKAYLRKNIAAKIGVDEFKNGLVSSISLPDSDRIRFGTASISIEERIKASNDGVLSELFDFIPSQQDVESFEENFSFSRGENSYGYTREVSLKWKQDPGNQFLNKARLFLKNVYLGARPAYGFQTDGISENGRFNQNLKPKISEFYDQINKEVRFSENFESNRIETSNGIPFSRNKTYDISLDEEGYSLKNYSVEISALSEPLELNILSGIQYTLQDILDESTGHYGSPIKIEKTIKSDAGSASMSVGFSNDPRKNAINNIEYIGRKSPDGAYVRYDFDLNIKSRGQNYLSAFNNALSYFSGNRHTAYSKMPILFSDFVSGSVFESSRNTAFNPFQASISENISFTTNPSYSGISDGILKREVNVSDNFQIGRNSIVPIYGDKEMIIRNEQGKTLGLRSVSVNVISSTGDFELKALQIASGEQPNSTYKYMMSKRSTLEPLENKASANIDFSYFNA
jgi:hypothetical protein